MGKFKYKQREDRDHKARAEQSGGMYAKIIREGIPEFRAKEGDYTFRLCPPTWKNAKHYGMDLWLNMNVGADNESFLSLKQMKNEPDPVAEAVASAKSLGDTDTADALKNIRRVGCYGVWKGEEDKGPQFWSMPWTFDRDLAAASFDKETKEIIWLDDPDEGYWVSFSVVKKAGFNNYTNIQVSRRSCPMSKDEDQQKEWLDFITENPIPDILNFYSYDHIKGVLAGQSKKRKKDDDDEDEPPPRTRARASRKKEEEEEEDEEQPPPRRKSRPKNDDEDAPLDEEPKRRKSREADDDEDAAPLKRRTIKKDDEEKDLRKSGGLKKRRRRKEEDDEDDDD